MSEDRIVIDLSEAEAQEFISLIRRVDRGLEELFKHFGLEYPAKLEDTFEVK